MTLPATLFRLVLIGFLAASASNGQQIRVLKGKVKPEKRIQDCSSETVSWSNITVKVTSNGHVIPPDPLRSNGEDWSHQIPVGTRVDIGFSFACYRPWQLETYTVKPVGDPQTLAEVSLRPLPNCPYCPRRIVATERNITATATATAASAAATATEVTKRADLHAYSEVFELNPESDKLSPAQLLADLKEDARIALQFGFLDTFQYNFEVLSATLVGKEFVKVLRDFRTSSEYASLFEPRGNRRPETFKKLVGSQFGSSEPLDFPLISQLVRDPEIDPSIRGSAVVTLLDSNLTSRQTASFQKILRAEMADTSNDLYLSAAIGLARIGTAGDRKRILANTASKDENQAVWSLTALRVAQITEGAVKFTWAIKPLAKIVNSTKEPEIRRSAIQALRPSIYYLRNPFAILTLSKTLKDHTNPEEVRAEAALGLGVGTLEQRTDVRGVLLTAAKDPTSELVRISASNSLAGRIQF